MNLLSKIQLLVNRLVLQRKGKNCSPFDRNTVIEGTRIVVFGGEGETTEFKLGGYYINHQYTEAVKQQRVSRCEKIAVVNGDIVVFFSDLTVYAYGGGKFIIDADAGERYIKLMDRETFLGEPPGTVFSTFECYVWMISGCALKHDTIAGTGEFRYAWIKEGRTPIEFATGKPHADDRAFPFELSDVRSSKASRVFAGNNPFYYSNIYMVFDKIQYVDFLTKKQRHITQARIGGCNETPRYDA